MITGFRKPKRSGNIRRKIVPDHEEDADASARKESPPVESELVPAAIDREKTRSKDKTKKSSKSGLLSFEDDLDSGDVFQVKKSKESKRLAQKLEHEKRTKKKLKDLPEMTRVAGEIAIDQGHSQTGSPANSYNSGSETSFSTSYSGKPCDDGDDILQSDDSLPPIKMELNAGLIPDAATIFAVKKRREQARQLGVMADFIPVVTKETNKYEGRFSNSKSRLIREDDEDDSDEDRMEFKGSSTKSFPALERRSQVAKALEEAQDEERNTDEEEDEVALWEKEQIKKGTGIPAAQSEPTYGPQIPPDYVGQVQTEVPIITSEQYFTVISQQTALGAGNILGVSSYQPTSQTVPTNIMPNFSSGSFVTVDMVAQRLSERLTSLMQVHRAHELEKEKIQNDLNFSTKNITTLEVSSSELSDRFTFFQDIQGYFQDFSECINEKIPKINECEKLIHLLWRVRAEKFSQRRADDVKDQDSEILGKSSKQSSGKDEFGRERGAFEESARKRRIAEREGRRSRRRRHREKAMSSEELMSYHEGLSSDDEELDSDVLRFEKDKEKVLSQAKDIFEDVIEDFSSVTEVQARFIQWRLGFQDSYKDAYADMSLPKVLDPFIRLELLSWNPLERNATVIDDMQWYRILTKFGDFEDKSKEEEEEHLKRVSLVVEKVLLPKITVFVESVWDPLSSKQTELLTACISGILKKHTFDESSKQKKNLLNLVIGRLRQVSENGMFLPLYGKGVMENKSSGAPEFLRRQFWSSYKLMKNTLCWLDMLPESDLQDITIDGILNRYLIAALQQFPSLHENSELCRTIISLFPKSWFERADDTILPGLQPFSRYLTGLAGSIYKSSLGYSSSEKKKAKLATKRIISLLMHMHAFDVARSVALDYKYDIS